MTPIVGCDDELAALERFLSDPPGEPAPLVLEGEAGIGKSTLWRTAVASAREHGLRVLSSRPGEAERGLAHVGPGDLFDGVLGDVLPALTPPRRRALEVALLIEDAAARPIDPRDRACARRTAQRRRQSTTVQGARSRGRRCCGRYEASGVNPFYALELARYGADSDPTQPLPVPESLEELLRARLEGFAGSTLDALVLASAHGRLTPAELTAAGIEPGALEPALAEHVIELTEGAVRYTHPLLASVRCQGLSADERRLAHRSLADLVDEPLGRARYLALATEQPDAEIAAALEQAANVASLLGAPIVAAELGERAATDACSRPGRFPSSRDRSVPTRWRQKHYFEAVRSHDGDD